MKILNETEDEPVVLDFTHGCTAEEHLVPCTFDVVAVAQTSCNNEVELWCSSAEAYYQMSLLSNDLCFDCEELMEHCWIVNGIEDDLPYS